MSRRVLVLAFALFLLIITGSQATGAEQNQQRLITVRGDAEIRVAPDQALIFLGVETWNKELNKAKEENDQRVKNVFRLLAEHQIPAGDIQTGYITVVPTYQTRYDARNNPTDKVLTGYRVEKAISVTMKDLSKFEKVLSTVYQGGANRVSGVTFRNSELRKHRDKARGQAIRAAKEKAEALTREIGQAIGQAFTITEDNISLSPYRVGSQNVSQNVSSTSGIQGGSDSTIAPGRISVTAQVTVSFELQ
jgi:uncharacterized protein